MRVFRARIRVGLKKAWETGSFTVSCLRMFARPGRSEREGHTMELGLN